MLCIDYKYNDGNSNYDDEFTCISFYSFSLTYIVVKLLKILALVTDDKAHQIANVDHNLIAFMIVNFKL